MAKITIPIKIDGFECVEDMVQAVLNYSYKGRTLKEWADGIAEPKTNADRIRAMTDEELADIMGPYECVGCPVETETGECLQEGENCYKALLRWLKSPVEVDNG